MGGFVWDDWDIYVMDADGANLRRITQQKYGRLERPQFSSDKTKVIFAAGTNLFQVSVAGTRPPEALTINGHTSPVRPLVVENIRRRGHEKFIRLSAARSRNLYPSGRNGTPAHPQSFSPHLT